MSKKKEKKIKRNTKSNNNNLTSNKNLNSKNISKVETVNKAKNIKNNISKDKENNINPKKLSKKDFEETINQNTQDKNIQKNIDNNTQTKDKNNSFEKAKKLDKKKHYNNKITLLLSLLLIFGGVIISLYPSVSNYFAEKNQVEIIEKYDELVVSIDAQGVEEELQKAQTYNENLAGDPVHDPFVEGSGYALPTNYTSILNFTDSGIMAYIEIPKISVHLPIYHGTSSEVLEKGVGHIQSTSLPIGGESTHCVLTGHTGLPSAELFTRLDELDIGDIFYIHVLNKVLTYKVYETKVILPDKIDELQVVPGKDYITLVTCTPYGVNTHRLLVKAEQVEYEEYVEPTQQTTTTPIQDIEDAISEKDYYFIGITIGILILLVLLIIFIIKLIIKKFIKHN